MNFLRNLTTLALIGLIVGFLAFTLARYSHYAELFSHFVLQYAVGAVITFLIVVLFKLNRWKIGLSTLLAGFFIVQLYMEHQPNEVVRTQTSETISVLQYNIYAGNTHIDELVIWLRDKDADIIVLQEVTPRIAEILQPLKRDYPHHIIASSGGAFGMALYSKFPFIEGARKQIPGSWNHYAVVQMHTPKHHIPFTLTEVHPVHAMRTSWHEQRVTELNHIGDVVAGQSAYHRVLVGDMNLSPYSPWFRDLEEKTGLHNVAREFVFGSWPAHFPALFRIPIDHMFISQGIERNYINRLDNIGSDHMPLLTLLTLYKQP